MIYVFAPFKGLDTSLRAIEIARAQFPDLQVTAFGPRTPADEFPLPPGTHFTHQPAQEDIPGLYASCDAWVLGSRFEGFGLPTLEAMACHTPVVATRAGAAPDLIEHGVNGYLADIDDAETLGAGLVELLSKSPEDWRAMSTAAHKRAHNYTWDDATDAFEAALKKKQVPLRVYTWQAALPFEVKDRRWAAATHVTNLQASQSDLHWKVNVLRHNKEGRGSELAISEECASFYVPVTVGAQ